MGRGYTEYLMPNSNRSEWVLSSAFIDYRLADGTKLHILQQEAWCSNCGRFVLAEQIPSVAELEEEISKFQKGDPETLELWAFASNGIPKEERIAELHRYIQWRRERKSPPRCLECGQENPMKIPGHDEFSHPQTGERVVVGSSGWADAAPWEAEFTPEGLPIG